MGFTITGGVTFSGGTVLATGSGGGAGGGGGGGGLPTRTTGNVLVVGAPYIDEGGITNSGAVYLYNTQSLGTAPTKLSGSDISGMEASGRYGVSAGVTGTQIVVGYPYHDTNTVTNAGELIVYEYANLSATPTLLTTSDAAGGDMLGRSVLCNEDKIIAQVRDGGSGAVYVWDANNLSTAPTKLTRPDRSTDGGSSVYEEWGQRMAINSTHLFIGAAGYDGGSNDTGDNRGGVWAYTLSDLSASPTKLVSADVTASYTNTSELFGKSIDANDTYVVVGAPLDDSGGTNYGAAYVYDATDLSATPTRLTTSTGAASNRQFGSAVCLSDDYIWVGAPNQDSNVGALHRFAINSGSFSYDGQHVFTGGGTSSMWGKICMWDYESERLFVGASRVPNQTFVGKLITFKYNTGTSSWDRDEYVPSEIAGGDEFGFMTAVMGGPTMSNWF
jgi:hypothetical protein